MIFVRLASKTICQLVAAGFWLYIIAGAGRASAHNVPQPPFVIRPLQSRNDSRRVGLVWRRGYPKARELALLGNLIIDNPPAGTRPRF